MISIMINVPIILQKRNARARPRPTLLRRRGETNGVRKYYLHDEGEIASRWHYGRICKNDRSPHSYMHNKRYATSAQHSNARPNCPLYVGCLDGFASLSAFLPSIHSIHPIQRAATKGTKFYPPESTNQTTDVCAM